ncbi:Gti1/Pac2 family-domain-containing protein [Mycena rebaudengoi]|nr:Gti1/Pac2 family-domain-containing protein [Mycena rebaudengoi]
MTEGHSKVGENTTHPCLYIRTIDDALKVLEAARSNVLPLIRHRLRAQERAQLKSGNVFVWEESSRDCLEGGLVRWTEGRKWSQSRFRRDFFVYKEKLGIVGKTKSERCLVRSSSICTSDKCKENVHKLTKKTYSTVLIMPGSSVARKWHLVAYFSDCDKDRLPVIENYEYLKYIQVPPDVFLTTHKLPCRLQSIQSPHHSRDIVEQKARMEGSRPISTMTRRPAAHLKITETTAGEYGAKLLVNTTFLRSGYLHISVTGTSTPPPHHKLQVEAAEHSPDAVPDRYSQFFRGQAGYYLDTGAEAPKYFRITHTYLSDQDFLESGEKKKKLTAIAEEKIPDHSNDGSSFLEGSYSGAVNYIDFNLSICTRHDKISGIGGPTNEINYTLVRKLD